jgi:predicted RNA-binding Zn ribbon-like protein
MDLSGILVGGSLWLDLVNTIHMRDSRRIDLFDDNEAVQSWLSACGLMQQEQFINLQQENKLTTLLKDLRSIREICHQILLAIEQSHEITTPVFSQLQTFIKPLRLMIDLTMQNGMLTRHYRGADLTDDILYKIANSVVDTLQQVSWDRLKQCQHEDCILHFVDTSKAGKRRWCSMETCGNRYKAAQFYSKKKRQAE